MRKYCLIILFHVFCTLMLLNNCYSQEVKHITNVRGKIAVRETETSGTAKYRAIFEARVDALRLAGLLEFPRGELEGFIYDFVHNKYLEEYFYSPVYKGIEGSISGCKLIGLEYNFSSEDNHFIVEAIIDADIVRFDSQSESKINVRLDSLKSIISFNEELSFSINSAQECYLTSFLLSNKKAVLLNTSANETFIKLDAGIQKTVSYGKINDKILSDLSFGDVCLLVQVLLTNPIRFTDYATKCSSDLPDLGIYPDDILLWFYCQSPNTREIIYNTIEIRN